MNLRMLNLSEIKRKKIFYYRLNGKVSYDLMSRVQKYCVQIRSNLKCVQIFINNSILSRRLTITILLFFKSRQFKNHSN